jgi:DNA-binding response OmpR family regulator
MKREGYEVAIAEDGQAALDALEEKAPDLVILDVMLPRMSGFEVCRHIRADARWRGLKILMLTAKGRDSEMQKGLDLGADAYVTKPFSTRDLVTRIRTMLGAKA